MRFREIEKRKRRLTALKPLGYLLRFREILKKSPIFFARLRRKKKKETNVAKFFGVLAKNGRNLKFRGRGSRAWHGKKVAKLLPKMLISLEFWQKIVQT